MVPVVARAAVARSGLNNPVGTSALDQIEDDDQASVTALGVDQVVARLDAVAWDLQESETEVSDDYMSARTSRPGCGVRPRPRQESSARVDLRGAGCIGSVDAVRHI